MHKEDPTVKQPASGAREIDRRTIAKGVAWTVPVVIVATAAPAAAASGVPTTTFISSGGQGSGWSLSLTVSNTRTTSVAIQLLTLYKNGGSQNLITGTVVDVATGTTSVPVYAAAGGSANKKGDEFALTFRVLDDPLVTQTVTLA
ncbi:hypothetical protein [Pedococcus sp. 2YAF34]|uniref:hypothetical protein n=1 Tax=Pedococcus sp. 2YAF34 TaxID=3233032 RepID=UPI003F97E276